MNKFIDGGTLKLLTSDMLLFFCHQLFANFPPWIVSLSVRNIRFRPTSDETKDEYQLFGVS